MVFSRDDRTAAFAALAPKDSTKCQRKPYCALPRKPASSNCDTGSDRRTDVDAKTARVAALLQAVGCEGLLLSGAGKLRLADQRRRGPRPSRPVVGPRRLLQRRGGRWLIASNVDSQRLFDEELDGLGFQLKEWPWHWGREQLLADLCQNRRVASDQPLGDCRVVADEVRQLRRSLTVYEQACLLTLGQARHARPGGHLPQPGGQRHRARDRRPGRPSPDAPRRFAGPRRRCRRRPLAPLPRLRLHLDADPPVRRPDGHRPQVRPGATASRSVSFGGIDAEFRKEHNARLPGQRQLPGLDLARRRAARDPDGRPPHLPHSAVSSTNGCCRRRASSPAARRWS